MRFKNIPQGILLRALDDTNRLYNDNVKWKVEPSRIGRNLIHATLKVKNSQEKGAKVTNGRKSVNACYHVFGDFIDAILDRVNNEGITSHRITTALGIIETKSENWKDINIGSLSNPLNFSEACECYMELK